MADSLIVSMLAELKAALPLFAAKLEGLRDFEAVLRRPEEAEAKQQVGQAIVRYQARLDAMLSAASRLQVLIDDDYPAALPVGVPAAVYTTLKGNVDTISAAFGELHPTAEAVGGDIVFTDKP